MWNRMKAVEYAQYWAKNRNPNFYDFDKLGGDCTNFISQCLNFGGIKMCEDWFYYNLNLRSPSWTSVENFYDFFMKSGAKSFKNLNFVQMGDVIQLKQSERPFNHSLIVTKISFDEIFVCAHSVDALNKKLSDYSWLDIRVISLE